jgi:uncharacterized protein YjdB
MVDGKMKKRRRRRTTTTSSSAAKVDKDSEQLRMGKAQTFTATTS